MLHCWQCAEQARKRETVHEPPMQSYLVRGDGRRGQRLGGGWELSWGPWHRHAWIGWRLGGVGVLMGC